MRSLIVLIVTGWFVYSQIGEFKKETIAIGKKTLSVEVARSPEEMAKGLMFRKQLGADEGMLFIYQSEEPRHFWMKNTFIPLSIGFFNKNRELIDVQEMEPVKSEMQVDVPTYKSEGSAMYALEMPQGWFKKNKIEKNKGIKFNFKK